MEKHEKSSSSPGKWRQFLLSIIVNILMVSYGEMIGWPSPYSPQLQSSSSPVGREPMTDEDVSWLSAIMCLSGLAVTVLFSIIPDKYSRKRFGYFLVLPVLVSWLIIIFATEHMHIFIARLLCGVSGSAMFYFIPTYISEISDDSIRGLLGSVTIFVLNLGILLAYIMGGMLSMRIFAIINLVFPVLYLIGFVFMPESPVYLVRQNRIREAARSLIWLKAGDSLAAERTLSHLQAEVRQTDVATKPVKLTDLFRDRATIKGLIIVLGLFSGQQLCGIFAMLTYSETIFAMSDSSLTPNAASIVVATIQLFGSFLALIFIERGRRLLLLVSTTGMFLCHSAIGAFFYFQEFGHDVSTFSWVPVVALSIFMVVYSSGMGSVPLIVTSEIFSRDLTSLGITIGLCSLWICAFIMVKMFSSLVAALGMYGCFFLLAILCVSSFIFYFVLLPETKGRTREDIVDELNGKRCTKSENDAKHIVGTHSTHAVQV